MRLINHDSKSTALTALCTLLLSCGDLTDEEKGTPQPKVKGQSESLFSLENGTYYMSEIQALNDGCKKNPLDAQDSITQVPFIVENKSDGEISIDFCSFNGQNARGTVLGNHGVLTAHHSPRRFGSGSTTAVFDQRCLVTIDVVADNHISGQYKEFQSQRNEVLRRLTVDQAECTTQFEFTFKKKESPTAKE